MNLQNCKPSVLALVLMIGAGGFVVSQESDRWFDRKGEWRGNDQFHFQVAGRKAYLVVPSKPAEGKPWIWRARFPNFHDQMDIQLVQRGYHIGYVDVAGLYGCPQAIEIGDAFYDFVTRERGLSPKPIMEGVSRGGLFVYNWIVANPDTASCIYCDTPVCDFRSWPGGKGQGIGSAGSWQQCLAAYGLTEEEATQYEGNPVDQFAKIASAKIPILHIVSETDVVVPPSENTYLLQKRLQSLGRELEVISVPRGTSKSNGHHFNHPAVDRVVRFMMDNTSK